MVFFELVFSTVLGIISSLGYAGVFVLMAMESMIFPVPSEAVMPFAGYLAAQGQMDFVLLVVTSTLGSIAGSLLSYYIGLKGESYVRKRWVPFLNAPDLDQAKAFFKKHGEKTIFVARFIPVVRHLISIPAGFGKMDLKKFVLYTALGAGIWNAALAYSGVFLNKNWRLVSSYSQYMDVLAIVGMILFAAWYASRHVRHGTLLKKGPSGRLSRNRNLSQ